jgi:hypothetical protein
MVAELEHLANLAQIDREIDDPEGEAARACTLKRCRRARACREPETCTQSAMEDVRIAQANAVKEAEEEARRAPQRRARPRQEAR